jgi:hypothetical protein
MYVRNLKKFLNLIPNNIFEEFCGTAKIQRNRRSSNSIYKSCKKDIQATKFILKSYIKETKKDVDTGKLKDPIQLQTESSLSKHYLL